MRGVRFLSTRADNFLVSERRKAGNRRKEDASEQTGWSRVSDYCGRCGASASGVKTKHEPFFFFNEMRPSSVRCARRLRPGSIPSCFTWKMFTTLPRNRHFYFVFDVGQTCPSLSRSQKDPFPKFTAAALVQILARLCAYFLARVTRARVWRDKLIVT